MLYSESYGRYKNSRNAAWQTLIDFQVKELPIKLADLAKKADITIKKNSEINILKPNTLAISFLLNNKWIIVYDNTFDNIAMIRFSIAHEMGHIFLGHELQGGYHQRTFNVDKPQVETEADIFASRLLAPACVLWGLKLHTPEEIMKVCNISLSAAKIRAERMKILYKRNKFLTSPLEQKVYNNFKDFISRSNT